MKCNTILEICRIWRYMGFIIPPMKPDGTILPPKVRYSLTTTSKTICTSERPGNGTADVVMNGDGIVTYAKECSQILVGQDGKKVPDEECSKALKLCTMPGCEVPKDDAGNDANAREATKEVEIPAREYEGGKQDPGAAWCDAYKSSPSGTACADANQKLQESLFEGRENVWRPPDPSEYLDVLCPKPWLNRNVGKKDTDITIEPNPPPGMHGKECRQGWITCGNQTQKK